MEVRFLCDGMLGKLAKWLRVIGYDTHYQSYYKSGEIARYISNDERLLLTRNRTETAVFSKSFRVLSDQVKDQIRELIDASLINLTDRSQWFTRCILCNTPLKKAETEEARDRVPDYAYSQNIDSIRHCPSCRRYFWPGSHRGKMISRLEEWGLWTGCRN